MVWELETRELDFVAGGSQPAQSPRPVVVRPTRPSTTPTTIDPDADGDNDRTIEQILVPTTGGGVAGHNVVSVEG